MTANRITRFTRKSQITAMTERMESENIDGLENSR